MLQSGNPLLSEKNFRAMAMSASEGAMTVQGTINKTAALIGLVILGAAFTWSKFLEAGPSAMAPWLIAGAVIGIVSGLITAFKPNVAHITAPIYAASQGLVMGAISAVFESQYPGIVMQAVALTFGVMVMMLALYKTGVIKVTEKFKMGVVAATGGLALVYLISFILGIFGLMPTMLFGNGPIGIGFGFVVVAIAALNLVMDFDMIEQNAAMGAPKSMEWFGAFGLAVTLIWLYIEILRLLMRFRSRD